MPCFYVEIRRQLEGLSSLFPSQGIWLGTEYLCLLGTGPSQLNVSCLAGNLLCSQGF